jgi:hypothetical protein
MPVDWNLAIEWNTEALKRILVALVAMAGGASHGWPLPVCKPALPY